MVFNVQICNNFFFFHFSEVKPILSHILYKWSKQGVLTFDILDQNTSRYLAFWKDVSFSDIFKIIERVIIKVLFNP
jgi:hypothetical protein